MMENGRWKMEEISGTEKVKIMIYDNSLLLDNFYFFCYMTPLCLFRSINVI